MTTDKAAAIVV